MKWDINILMVDAQPELEEAQDYAEEANEILKEVKIPEDFYYSSLSDREGYFNIVSFLESSEKMLENKIVDLIIAEMKNNLTAESLKEILKHMTWDEYRQELWYNLYGKEDIYEDAEKMAEGLSQDEFFMMFSPKFIDEDGNYVYEYGVNQGVLWENYFEYSNGKKQTFDGYGRLVYTVMKRYNMSEKDAYIATLKQFEKDYGIKWEMR